MLPSPPLLNASGARLSRKHKTRRLHSRPGPASNQPKHRLILTAHLDSSSRLQISSHREGRRQTTASRRSALLQPVDIDAPLSLVKSQKNYFLIASEMHRRLSTPRPSRQRSQWNPQLTHLTAGWLQPKIISTDSNPFPSLLCTTSSRQSPPPTLRNQLIRVSTQWLDMTPLNHPQNRLHELREALLLPPQAAACSLLVPQTHRRARYCQPAQSTTGIEWWIPRNHRPAHLCGNCAPFGCWQQPPKSVGIPSRS